MTMKNNENVVCGNNMSLPVSRHARLFTQPSLLFTKLFLCLSHTLASFASSSALQHLFSISI